ncbi:MAG: HDOD domain-containing protein [Zetaproteobacteria bacterium CG12_big_fil_rev_8_21_14_0_65_55_1124]|nr:MAG: HDOD domain-containing protein [Zetaproteobacteria bacterium CG1_02_55_237]PIS19527.1 MAG: HDOD domain-containing protein [Zetaproteobacteria bacterium CG08_land_8_20_14_0_20_55_17]PIW42372.1 MAG: HDOD domain-containing protein [Zetaproteobacteria bacterium CG12_big_fil_rev_8_21_14_0_65_55_1124]PIY52827.1 MAG: HDOD domain-containing protein [Zetaproteobacteria bacterium CG_4_10_14_0_8_um_filter_55_43]PIZ38033.1 MAG: HDOD domain-containing protein [Zetaproteobacteria bacterium CG_4_10_14
MSANADEIAARIRQKFNAGEARLPVLPDAVLKVRNIIADDRKGSTDIAKAIAESPAFSAAVLRIANSPRFNPSRNEIRNLPMAIQRIGSRQVLQLLMAIASSLYMQVKQPELQDAIRRNFNHSLAVAVAAQHLAQMIPQVSPEDAFITGLLHKIGVPTVICAVPDDMMACDTSRRIEILQKLHREMGARLFHYWNLPDIFSQVILHQGIESDDRPRDKLIDFVDAASYITQHLGHEPLLDAAPEDVDPLQCRAIKRLGISESHIAAIEIELDDSLEEMQQAFNGG